MQKRVQKLVQKMELEHLESFLITSPYNLRYLTGFTGTTGWALITREKNYFITDFRYTEQAAKQCDGYEIIQNKKPLIEEVAQLVNQLRLKNLAFEEDFVSYSLYVMLEELMETELIGVAGIVEEMREVKDSSEIAIIKKACSIADSAFTHILDYITPGKTEIEVATELDFYMRSLGATGVSFDIIVASGVRSAMPHGVASQKIIEKGDFVTLDFGCYYEGYVSDMTRTISIGKPSEQLVDIYDIVLEAQRRVIKEAKPGVSGIMLDNVARDYIAKNGYGEEFGHSTGHGIGLEIHEGPNVSRLAEKLLVPGNIITDEPGIYLPGIGGVRIEDDILITETGYEVLTHSSKELIVL